MEEKVSTPMEAIKAALRIQSLWLPSPGYSEEDKCEAEALTKMHEMFEEVIAAAPKETGKSEDSFNSLRVHILVLLWRHNGTSEAHHLKWLLNEILKVLFEEDKKGYDAWIVRYGNNEHVEWDKGIAP
jgi:hypothetical protein